MRDLARAQPERPPELPPLGDEGGDAAVVEAQHLLDDEQREELRLRVVVARARTRIARQRLLADRQRLARQLHG